jgi:hypothetical protein
MMKMPFRVGVTALMWIVVVGCASTSESYMSGNLEFKPAETGDPIDFPLRHNLDGDVMESQGWKEALFPGRSTVRVEDEAVYLDRGEDMTGITWRGPLATMNYEVTLDAMRVDGSDFFCGLTLPYGEAVFSFVVGGWGGTCVGISSVDYYDAYNNETARFREFETGQWYRIRVRCTEDKIEAWIDDDQLVDLVTTDRVIGIRWEMADIVPFGVATWQTTGAIRNVEIRKFEPGGEAG